MDRSGITIVPDRARNDPRWCWLAFGLRALPFAESPASGRCRPCDRFHSFRRLASCDRFGDIPITRDQAADGADGAFVPKRPRRLCIGSRAFLHPAVAALHSATSASRTNAGTPASMSGCSTRRTPFAAPALIKGGATALMLPPKCGSGPKAAGPGQHQKRRTVRCWRQPA